MLCADVLFTVTWHAWCQHALSLESAPVKCSQVNDCYFKHHRLMCAHAQNLECEDDCQSAEEANRLSFKLNKYMALKDTLFHDQSYLTKMVGVTVNKEFLVKLRVIFASACVSALANMMARNHSGNHM